MGSQMRIVRSAEQLSSRQPSCSSPRWCIRIKDLIAPVCPSSHVGRESTCPADSCGDRFHTAIAPEPRPANRMRFSSHSAWQQIFSSAAAFAATAAGDAVAGVVGAATDVAASEERSVQCRSSSMPAHADLP
eukprot:5655311-Pleurochrysis_carterae.AAC.5